MKRTKVTREGVLGRTFRGSSLEGYVEASRVRTLDKFRGRRMPTKTEIIHHARRIELEDIGLPTITPTEQELKEKGTFRKARLQLMRDPATEGQLQQRKYLDQLASELKLKLIPRRGLVTLRKETGFEWTNGWTRHERGKVAPQAPLKPSKVVRRARIPQIKPKKRKKLHTTRTSATMRKLRKVKGVKVFSFKDDVWKVRKPRGRRRKR